MIIPANKNVFLLFGGLFIACVLVFPRGIVGSLSDLRGLRRERAVVRSTGQSQALSAAAATTSEPPVAEREAVA